jgi:hypothetical protein
MKPLPSISLSLLLSLALLIHLPMTYQQTYTEPDCVSSVVGEYMDVAPSNDAFTYGMQITLDATTFPTCYHYAFYGFAIIWDSADDANVGVSYYEWAESSGTCSADADLTSITTSNKEFYTTNDFDPNDDDPCGYTIYLTTTSGTIVFEFDTNNADVKVVGALGIVLLSFSALLF